MSKLTDLETKIICLVIDGLRQKQVCDQVGISRERVSQHLRAARNKLGAKTTLQAIAIFAREEERAKSVKG